MLDHIIMRLKDLVPGILEIKSVRSNADITAVDFLAVPGVGRDVPRTGAWTNWIQSTFCG